MNEDNFTKQSKRLENVFKATMAAAISAAGTQKKLAEQTGIHQSRISEYVNGNYDFSSLTLGTLIKLFPDLDICYNTEPANEDDTMKAIEQRLLLLFRRLPVNEKILCYENVIKTYGDVFSSTKEDKS